MQDSADLILKSSETQWLDDEKNWVVIEGFYQATGKEKFLIIGSYSSNEQMEIKLSKELKDCPDGILGQYYIGAIGVFKAPNRQPSEIIELNTWLTYEQLNFNMGDSVLSNADLSVSSSFRSSFMNKLTSRSRLFITNGVAIMDNTTLAIRICI